MAVVYAWPIASEANSTVYEVVLHDSGKLTCPCPSWIWIKEYTCPSCNRKSPAKEWKHATELKFGKLRKGDTRQICPACNTSFAAGVERRCKHTEEVRGSATRIYADWRAGGALPAAPPRPAVGPKPVPLGFAQQAGRRARLDEEEN